MEARGFILGGAVAHQVSAGFIPIRKKGKAAAQARLDCLFARNTASTRWRCTRTPCPGREGHPGRRPDRDRRHRRKAR
jgi:hypothetical protein